MYIQLNIILLSAATHCIAQTSHNKVIHLPRNNTIEGCLESYMRNKCITPTVLTSVNRNAGRLDRIVTGLRPAGLGFGPWRGQSFVLFWCPDRFWG